jgi:hypothetical protein
LFLQGLHEDDRLALVKHNLVTILYLHFCICTNTDTEIFHEPNTPTDFCYKAQDLRAYSDKIYYDAMKLATDLQQVSANDPLLIKILMLIMIFSKGADWNEPHLREPEKIFHVQNIFVNLLWNYLTVRFGCESTSSVCSRLLFSCMKAHSIARESKESVAKKNVYTDDLAPLMQSVLRTSY